MATNTVTFELETAQVNYSLPIAKLSPSHLMGWPFVMIRSPKTSYINVSKEDKRVIDQFLRTKFKPHEPPDFYSKNIYIDCIPKPYYLGIIHYELVNVYESEEDND